MKKLEAAIAEIRQVMSCLCTSAGSQLIGFISEESSRSGISTRKQLLDLAKAETAEAEDLATRIRKTALDALDKIHEDKGPLINLELLVMNSSSEDVSSDLPSPMELSDYTAGWDWKSWNQDPPTHSDSTQVSRIPQRRGRRTRRRDRKRCSGTSVPNQERFFFSKKKENWRGPASEPSHP